MAKINRFALLIGCVCLLTVTARAQNPSNYYEETPRTFYGGLIFGANFSQVDGDNYAGYHKVGINAGGIVYTQFAEHLAASIEILFSQKGSRGHKPQISNDPAFVINKYNINLNYAEVPIMLNYFDKRRSHFGAGFSISRLVSVKETIETNPTDPINFDNYPFQKMDYNFIVGGNLHLVKGFFLNARFQYSLASIRKDGPPRYSRTNSQFNNMWTVRLMYLF